MRGTSFKGRRIFTGDWRNVEWASTNSHLALTVCQFLFQVLYKTHYILTCEMGTIIIPHFADEETEALRH